MIAADEIGRLRARVAELEDELAEWRRQRRGQCEGAEMDRVRDAVVRFRMTPIEARVLLRLIDRAPRVLTKDQLTEVRPLHWAPEVVEEKWSTVYVCKVRRKLRLSGTPASIHTAWGDGFYMTAADAAVVRQEIAA